MIRWNRVAVACGCAVVIAGIALAFTPVTILPSSILPGPVSYTHLTLPTSDLV